MAMAQTAYQARTALCRRRAAAENRTRRAEMPLFQAFLRPPFGKSTDGHCIKDVTTIDPFCGSGTIPIEAAMIAMNRAPGLSRQFDAEKWQLIEPQVWQQERERAWDCMYRDRIYDIIGSDIDPACAELAAHNAQKAGTAHTIRFGQKDACTLRLRDREGTLICNPPYGERLMDIASARKLMRNFGTIASRSPMKQYIISSDEDFEAFFGVKADKKRKLYNGMLRCNLFMYYQPPEKRNLSHPVSKVQNNRKNRQKKRFSDHS